MPGRRELGQMSHAELAAMRDQPGASQGMLAPFEHRAFAREWAQESPVLAGLSLPFAIPAYSVAKKLGLMGARTPASLDEVFAGYHGYAEGMLDNLVPSAQAQEAPPAGMLDRLLHQYQTPVQDAVMRVMWGEDGARIPRPQFYPHARDQWEEMLERDMWRHINSQPGLFMGVNGAMPTVKRPAPPKRTPSDGVRG